jgi:hypothetical protein
MHACNAINVGRNACVESFFFFFPFGNGNGNEEGGKMTSADGQEGQEGEEKEEKRKGKGILKLTRGVLLALSKVRISDPIRYPI